MTATEVVRAFLGSLLDTGYAPSEIRAAFKECGFVSDRAAQAAAAEPVAEERDVRLTVEEIAFLLNELTPDHDGSDFEAECPSCTAYRKLAASVDWPARHGAHGVAAVDGPQRQEGQGE